MDLTTDRIRALNDELRRNLPNGHAVMTTGSPRSAPKPSPGSSKPSRCTTIFVTPTTRMKNTTLGSFEADGAAIFFKIDYFDKDLRYHSPDPSDPSVTERVITIMLAEEY